MWTEGGDSEERKKMKGHSQIQRGEEAAVIVSLSSSFYINAV